jgi:hypothetical protein
MSIRKTVIGEHDMIIALQVKFLSRALLPNQYNPHYPKID